MTSRINNQTFDISNFTLPFIGLDKNNVHIDLLDTQSHLTHKITVAKVGCFERTLFCFFRVCYRFLTLGYCDYKERYYTLKGTTFNAEYWVRISDVSDAYQKALSQRSEPIILETINPVFRAPGPIAPASPPATESSAQIPPRVETSGQMGSAQSTSTLNASSSSSSSHTSSSSSHMSSSFSTDSPLGKRRFDPSKITAAEVKPMSELLTKLTKHLYTDKKKFTCIFCFNHPDDVQAIRIAASVLDRFPPGFYFCCITTTTRVMDVIHRITYKSLFKIFLRAELRKPRPPYSSLY